MTKEVAGLRTGRPGRQFWTSLRCLLDIQVDKESRQLGINKFEIQGENPKLEIEIWMVFKALGVMRLLKE